jgi:hypothetical protein
MGGEQIQGGHSSAMLQNIFLMRVPCVYLGLGCLEATGAETRLVD